MGLMDKIKNALFEVEYVEVEEQPKKKEKKTREEKEQKPIAKKIVLPGKREERLEELHEEELQDEDFEIRPKDEPLEEEVKDEFKIMDDNDFKVDEDIVLDEPEIVQVLEEEEPASAARESKPQPATYETRAERTDYYANSTTSPVSVTRESKPYGVDNSYEVPIHPYGTYEKKEEKAYFRPSPIISPIYGILDKNYKKEDVKEKREVHITSYTKGNVSVDDVRKKAYGNKNVDEEPKVEEKEEPTKFEVEQDDNVLVDLSDRAKPEVKEITMGDAVEYFQDLGLEYNVDYVDASTERNTLKNPEEVQKEKESSAKVEKVEEIDMDLTKDLEDTMDLGSKTKVQDEVKKEKTDNVGDETNDNLFDLIDSMYQENE